MAAMNAAFHVKWEREMETKGVNVRWNFKLKIKEEVKKCAIKRKVEAKP